MRSTSLHIPAAELTGSIDHIPEVKLSICKVLVYFDIFHYPLTASETRRFLDRKSSEADLHEAFNQLLQEKKVYLHQGYFSIQDNPLLAARRNAGNKRADAMLKKAEKIGKFLSRFPFVRAIGISGSLSKNYADEKADIDFFIITCSNRLWLARTLMHLYKKLAFIFNRQHYYCMNYYIDENALLVKDQNIFTATEIKTLIPVYGKSHFDLFFEENSWTHNWLPVLENKSQVEKDASWYLFKNTVEWLLKGRLGNLFENHFFKLTRKRWRKKQEKGKLNVKGQTMDLIIDRHFSYSNPGNFKEKVLSIYRDKLKSEEIKLPTISAV